jgi:hypothetical protein
MEFTKEEMSKLKKQPANKLDIASFTKGLMQFHEEVVGNYKALLSEIEGITKENESAYSSLEKKIEDEIRSLKADKEEKEMIINKLTAKNKSLSRRLTILTIFSILPYIAAIAFLCWLYLYRAV